MSMITSTNPDTSAAAFETNMALAKDLCANVWETDLDNSDPLGDFLSHLDVGFFKCKAINIMAPTVTCVIGSHPDGTPNYLHMEAKMALGIVKNFYWRLDGTPYQFEDPDTGAWTATCSSGMVDGSKALVMITEGKLGLVRESRYVKDGKHHIVYEFWPSKADFLAGKPATKTTKRVMNKLA